MKLFREITADSVKFAQIPASAATEPAVSTALDTQRLVVADAGGMHTVWDTVKSVFK